jgi:hypothetical protein
MKTKHIFLILLVSVLIVGCCISKPIPPVSSDTALTRKTIELVGFVPKDEAQRQAFEGKLGEYNKTHPEIFKVRRYGVANAPEWGAMKDIGCDLEGMIKFWVDHDTHSKLPHTTGITDYAGRIGLTCSTSCGGQDPKISNKMVDDINNVIHPNGKKHHGD